ncbi:MAG TPA: hypothetical protein VF753_14455 [Terriglobales bacterium]
MIDTFLVEPKTVVRAKGDGSAVDVGDAKSRVFLLTLEITNIVEQESLDVAIYGSADGTTWGAKPLVSFTQSFYRGEQPLLLDLSSHPDTKFVKAHWEVNRWGRGSDEAMFEFGVSLKEIPADVLEEVKAQV